MTAVSFTKAQATGNDFVMIADPENAAPLTSEQVASLCDRHFGVGADGLIRVVRSERLSEGAAVLAEEPHAAWFMDYYNADGTVAEMCGNGIRAFARYLLASGLATLERGETLAVGTRAGVKDVQQTGTGGFQVDMGRWRLEGGEPTVTAEGIAVARPGLAISVGNPHIVVVLSSREELAQLRLAHAPEIEPAPADGANVEFIVPADPLVRDGVGRIRMRVHERGVGETQSCGTGAVAAALAVRHWAGEGAPNHWAVSVPGGVVQVRMFPTEEGEHVALAGPAALVYDGVITLPDDEGRV